MSKPQRRVILVGVGGATCSGKTTLAKHLRSILPNSVIIHQDDFAPPEELIPMHPVHNVADWDDPEGSIDWSRLRSFLKNVKDNGIIPPDHRSHDHLNKQKNLPLTGSDYQNLRARFQAMEDEQRERGIHIVWGLVDGFLLYWDKEVMDQLDVRFFLRVPHGVLKQRRLERSGYHTAVQFNPEGSFWKDPPLYWEQIVYPAYIKAHTDMFEGGDVENGKLIQGDGDLVLVEPVKEGAEMSIDEIVRRCCDVLWNFAHVLGLDE